MKYKFTMENLKDNLQKNKETQERTISNNTVMLQTEGIDEASRIILQHEKEIAEMVKVRVETLLNNLQNDR